MAGMTFAVCGWAGDLPGFLLCWITALCLVQCAMGCYELIYLGVVDSVGLLFLVWVVEWGGEQDRLILLKWVCFVLFWRGVESRTDSTV